MRVQFAGGGLWGGRGMAGFGRKLRWPLLTIAVNSNAQARQDRVPQHSSMAIQTNGAEDCE